MKIELRGTLCDVTGVFYPGVSYEFCIKDTNGTPLTIRINSQIREQVVKLKRDSMIAAMDKIFPRCRCSEGGAA